MMVARPMTTRTCSLPPPLLLLLLPVFLIVLDPVVCAEAATNNSVCETLGISPLPANDHKILVRNPSDPHEALVVGEDCVITSRIRSQERPGGEATLQVVRKGITGIHSYPRTKSLILEENGIRRADLTADSELVQLILSKNGIVDLGAFKFPSQLLEIDLVGNMISEIKTDELPKSLQTLYLTENRLSDATTVVLPPGLEEIDLSRNSFNSIAKIDFPQTLRVIRLNDNPLKSLENIRFPRTATKLELRNTMLGAVRGFRLPPSLQNLAMTGSEMKMIELHEADVQLARTLVEGFPAVQSEACHERTARRVPISASVTVCAINEDAFEELYESPATSSSASREASNPRTNPPTLNPVPQPEPSSNKTLVMIVIIGVILLGIVVCIGYRVLREPLGPISASRDSEVDENISSDPYTNIFSEHLDYVDGDIRYDDEFATHRIPQELIEKKRLLARGGFGSVYLASYLGREVAVKQLQREKLHSQTMTNFMKEIRLLIAMNHRNIVGFLGVSWTSLRDVSLVMEYMPRGDLFTLLRQHRKSEAPKSMFKRRDIDFQWFSKSSQYTKSSIALDVSSALAYMHSLATPVIHRDVKSKNVLLADDFTAKVTDFGISRLMTLEETMTREIGTVAWIAPEVLMGARYNEKADMYSFGVLLTELDTCHPPYTFGLDLDLRKKTNAWLASKISTGALQPPLTSRCPAHVRALALRCMNIDPDSRPSAVEIIALLKSMISSTR